MSKGTAVLVQVQAILFPLFSSLKLGSTLRTPNIIFKKYASSLSATLLLFYFQIVILQFSEREK